MQGRGTFWLLALLFFRQHTKTMTGLRRLIPLLDRVLVERVVAPTKSAGGVLLPESAVPKVRFS